MSIKDSKVTEIEIPHPIRGPQTKQDGLKSVAINIIDQFQELTLGSPMKQGVDYEGNPDFRGVVQSKLFPGVRVQ